MSPDKSKAPSNMHGTSPCAGSPLSSAEGSVSAFVSPSGALVSEVSDSGASVSGVAAGSVSAFSELSVRLFTSGYVSVFFAVSASPPPHEVKAKAAMSAVMTVFDKLLKFFIFNVLVL